MEPAYDFIVVGGGASGCVIASRLANSPAKPSVLLLEAGGTNKGVDHLSGAERFAVAFKPGSQLNWGYKTVPQFEQEIDYSRGKGLGGSTAINFCGWVIGADEDYNQWARLVDDNSFAWPHVKQCLQRIEKLHPEVPADFDHHILPKAEDHGVDGAIDVAYGAQWLKSTKNVFEAAKQSGFYLNPDVNSGNPIGMGIGTACIYNGKRITASSAYLSDPPDNLAIRTNSLVGRILISDEMATGVETVDGEIFKARYEVIVSGGAVNSPQLLLLSGIGPAEDLTQHGIEVVRDLPQVGRNLQDHCFSSAGVVLKRQSESSPQRQSPSPMGWFKLDALSDSAELQSLPDTMKTYLARPTVPHWELATNTPFFDGESIQADEEVFSAICLVMNPQSRGAITLKSADPTDAPRIDPAFLSHPCDRKVISEAMREMLRYFQAPVFLERTVRSIGWPESNAQDAVLNQCKSNLRSSWHACGTVGMGRDADTACVDSNFKVFGLRKLRVADMSICPLIPNNHTQSTAYVIGEIMAEKVIAEYGLDRLP